MVQCSYMQSHAKTAYLSTSFIIIRKSNREQDLHFLHSSGMKNAAMVEW